MFNSWTRQSKVPHECIPNAMVRKINCCVISSKKDENKNTIVVKSIMKLNGIILVCLLLCQISPPIFADYNFGLFENFVQVQEVAKKEVSLINQLKNLRSFLRSCKSAMIRRDFKLSHAVARNVTAINHSFLNGMSKLIKLDPDELMGAMKAMLLLQETYDNKPEHLLHGQIRHGNKTIQGRHKLVLDDLKQLAFLAFDQEWYDNCIHFLRAIHKFDNNMMMSKELDQLRGKVIKIHNGLLLKNKARIVGNAKLLPYLVDENLQRRKKQPKSLKKVNWYERRLDDPTEFNGSLRKEDSFRRICSNNISEQFHSTKMEYLQCHLVHHDDPYLKMAPLLLEQHRLKPYRMMLHKFLSDVEIDHLVAVSKPHLSKVREDAKDQSKRDVKTVYKSVQKWLDDIAFVENATYVIDEEKVGFQKYQLLPMDDMFGFDVADEILYKLSRKIEMATRTNVARRFASSRYQAK